MFWSDCSRLPVQGLVVRTFLSIVVANGFANLSAVAELCNCPRDAARQRLKKRSSFVDGHCCTQYCGLVTDVSADLESFNGFPVNWSVVMFQGECLHLKGLLKRWRII